jgi:WD40 repeat protein/transcriptional regulator with XRE-family HTH domain
MPASIPNTTLEKFSTFGDLLRFLRRRVGITQMELSLAVGYSDAQISRLEQNLRLPDIPTVEARFVPALGLESEPKTVARLLDLAANVRREDAPGLGLCPYKGLNYFDEGDADLFTGREILTNKLTNRILRLVSDPRKAKTRFLAIVGASGCGKSSLVRAGVVPALRWDKHAADWHIHVLTPTANPLESLAESLTADSKGTIPRSALADALAHEAGSLPRLIRETRLAGDHAPVLLVIDQFEELFALCHSADERAAFVGNLLSAATAKDGDILVIITLRADFYDRCGDYPELREALAQDQEYIGAMAPEELRRAIEVPARQGRWELEPGLADVLLHDVENEPGALPLLSHALLETWRRRRGRTLTLSGYASSGGVRGAIAETAETVFADQLTSDQRSIARRIFLRLTEFGDESSVADTRRRARLSELIPDTREASTTRAVLKTLADARLIITSEDSAEVAHEALIREWPTLRGWLEENREALRVHRQLTDAAHEWEAGQRVPDLLYRGARLSRAQEWAYDHPDEMNAMERGFLQESMEAHERQAAEREAQRQHELDAAQRIAAAERQRAEEHSRAAAQLRRRAVYLGGALAIAATMALAAFFLAAAARRSSAAAQHQERIAISRELAAQAISNLDVDPERSALLALRAADETHALDGSVLPEAVDALHRSLQRLRVKLILRPAGPGSFSPGGDRIATAGPDRLVRIWDAKTGELLMTLAGHSDKVMNTAFSPSGDRLVTASLDGTARVWDLRSGETVLVLEGHTDGLISPAYSPDGRQIVTTSFDGTARLWDAETGQMELTLQHSGPTAGPHFSPDGTLVAIADDKAVMARIWDTRTGKEVLDLKGHADGLNEVAFSPDGSQLATASSDFSVKLWDSRTGAVLKTLEGHTGWVYSVEFSPDGSTVISGSQDGTAKLWDAASGKLIMTLAGSSGGVGEVSISPDGRSVVTSGSDGTASVWDISAQGGRDWLTLAGHQDVVLEVTFSPDGERLATASWDHTVRIWNARSGAALHILRGHTDQVGGVAFSPDGLLVATAGYDGTARVWDAESGDELAVLRGHSGPVTGVAFSPTGALLATGGQDGSARLWNPRTGTQVRILEGHNDWVFRVAFSPDGSQLATASWDGTAKLWDVASGTPLATLLGHKGGVTAVDYSDDGRYIATASFDTTVMIWKIDDVLRSSEDAQAEPVQVLKGHAGIVWDAAFSPDGGTIASASFDGTAKIWDWEQGEAQLTLSTPSAMAFANVAFSPNGRLLAASGEDGTVRIYILPVEDLIAATKGRVVRGLTQAECQQYLHASSCPPAPD